MTERSQLGLGIEVLVQFDVHILGRIRILQYMRLNTEKSHAAFRKLQ